MSRLWRDIDLKRLAIPEDIRLKKDCVVVKEGRMTIEDADLFYRESLPAADSTPSVISVLLLHGRMFSSKTWEDLGTMNYLAAMGYRTVAVDLPGYANTPAIQIQDRASFLHSIIQSFRLENPVVVSPSMSGYYSLPYLIRSWKSLAGYIPVAPVGIEALEQLPVTKDASVKDEVYPALQQFLHDPIPDLSQIKTPTMVVFGEKDRNRSSALLNLLPMSQSQEIPNASHPAYLDDPPLWHQLLFNFLQALSEMYCIED